jgi:hypothetical protein
MGLDYVLYGKQVTQRKYEWFHHYRIGVGSNSSKPDGQHHVTARGWVPKSLERRVAGFESGKVLGFTGVSEVAVAGGWELSGNRNRALLWKKDCCNLGRIEWWENGKVSVYVRSPVNMGRVKQLLFQAFYKTGLIYDMQVFDKFAAGFSWSGGHDVFDVGVRLPCKVISAYQHLGIKAIKLGDRSHPTCAEIEWAMPDWVERLEFLLGLNVKAFDQWTAFMKDLGWPRRLDPKDRGIV